MCCEVSFTFDLKHQKSSTLRRPQSDYSHRQVHPQFSTNRKNGLNVCFHHVCKTTYSQLLSHISSWRSSVDSETLHWAPVCLKEASASCKMTRLLLTRGKRFPSLLCLIKRSVLSIILKCLMPQAWCADQMNALEAQWRLCKRQELNNGSGKSCSALSACL